jgi:oligosaccharide repeat unit polymerase
MLPFALSELNVIVTGDDTDAVIAAVPHVFLIAVLGYLMMVAGGALWRLKLGVGLRKTAFSILDMPARWSRMLMSSKLLLIIHTGICLALQILVLGIYFARNGFGFDLRSYTFADPSLRPVALLASNYSVTIAGHSFARYVEKREAALLVCTLLLTLGMFFFGARSNILAIYFGVSICYFIFRRRKLGLLRLGAIFASIALLALYLGSVRAGAYSLHEFFSGLVTLIFFGETFSDLRDFAWVYARWNKVLWMGKTYLAALAAFVPRVASSFRDTWGLGAATAATVGFDPHVHPGIRPGFFGESYFNFGYAGVVALGLFMGIATKKADLEIKQALLAPNPSMTRAFSYVAMLGMVSTLALTAGASGVYITLAIFVFSWFCLLVLSAISLGPNTT